MKLVEFAFDAYDAMDCNKGHIITFWICSSEYQFGTEDSCTQIWLIASSR